MNRARRIAGFAAIAAGMWGAGLLGWPVGPLALTGLLLCAAGPWLSPKLAAAPWPLLTLAVLAAIGGWVALGASPRAALGAALVYLQVHRNLARTGPGDDRVALLLSGLMLVAAASASEDLGWLGAFGLWLVAAPVALLPAGFRVGSRAIAPRAVGVGVVALALTLVLFPLLPRFRSEAPDSSTSLTGYSGQVELGAMNALLDDPEEVFRVVGTPDLPDTPMYFRGSALETFDGHRWTSGPAGDRVVSQAPDSYPPSATILQFTGIAPGGALFTAGRVRDLRIDGQMVRRDRHGAYRLDPPPEGPVSWTVVADGPWGPGSRLGTDDPRPDAYLQLPEDIDPRIAELARSLRGDETEARRISDRIADYLRTNVDYTRTPRDAGAEAPLTTFLFDRRSGHCEYFASAQAVLLRTLGIQARVVNGFVAGELDPSGPGRIIRRYHAHSWTEMWSPRSGWIAVDATPGPGAPGARSRLAVVSRAVRRWWEQSVVEFDRSAQREAVWAAGAAVEGAIRSRSAPEPSRWPWTGLAVIWGAGLVLAIALDRALRSLGAQLAGEAPERPHGPVDRAWRAARASAERSSGYRPPASLPPLSQARWLGERVEGVAAPLEELAWLLYRVRHGGEAEEPLVERARELLRRVQEAS